MPIPTTRITDDNIDDIFSTELEQSWLLFDLRVHNVVREIHWVKYSFGGGWSLDYAWFAEGMKPNYAPSHPIRPRGSNSVLGVIDWNKTRGCFSARALKILIDNHLSFQEVSVGMKLLEKANKIIYTPRQVGVVAFAKRGTEWVVEKFVVRQRDHEGLHALNYEIQKIDDAQEREVILCDNFIPFRDLIILDKHPIPAESPSAWHDLYS